eukprot:GHVT01076329.1.p1 GENE.GHVT01076329.1~~GHVT01076329.1.p1  ORF type:complete len:291 (-),score=55.43 GHVT01076329.1:963-1835(-)
MNFLIVSVMLKHAMEDLVEWTWPPILPPASSLPPRSSNAGSTAFFPTAGTSAAAGRRVNLSAPSTRCDRLAVPFQSWLDLPPCCPLPPQLLDIASDLCLGSVAIFHLSSPNTRPQSTSCGRNRFQSLDRPAGVPLGLPYFSVPAGVNPFECKRPPPPPSAAAAAAAAAEDAAGALEAATVTKRLQSAESFTRRMREKETKALRANVPDSRKLCDLLGDGAIPFGTLQSSGTLMGRNVSAMVQETFEEAAPTLPNPRRKRVENTIASLWRKRRLHDVIETATTALEEMKNP